MKNSTRSTKPRPLWMLTVFAGATALSALAGARDTKAGRGLWYRTLRKPRFQPPPAVFGPVWTALYAASTWSAWRVYQRPSSPARTAALALWGVQQTFNALWSPLFFGIQRPRLALADLVGLWASLVAYTGASAKVDKGAAALALPYLGWVSFAGVLNEEVVRLNPAVK